MVRIAPRYPDKLFGIIEALEDEQLSLAEVVRRVGAAAERAGIVRPSPVHVRYLLAELRAQRRDDEEIRAAGVHALQGVLSGRTPNPWVIQRALLQASERVEVRARRRRR